MRILDPVVQIPALSMNHAGQNRPFCSTVASKFIGDDHARSPSGGAQELAKEADRGSAIAFRLYENVDHRAVLIHRPPYSIHL
jgi:hypothetical protein